MKNRKLGWCFLLFSLVTIFSCKKNSENKRTIDTQKSYNGESGLIYYVPDTSVVLSQEERLTPGPGVQDSKWLENKLAWIVLPTQGYPQLAGLANESGDLTLAVNIDDIVEQGFSLTTRSSSSARQEVLRSKEDNYQKIATHRLDLKQQQSRLQELSSQKQTPALKKEQGEINQKIQNIEKILDSESSQFINPTDSARDLDVTKKSDEVLSRLDEQISNLQKNTEIETQTKPTNKALAFFNKIKNKIKNSTTKEKITMFGAVSAVTAVITTAAILSDNDSSEEVEEKITAPQIPQGPEDPKIQEPVATDTKEEEKKDTTNNDTKKTDAKTTDKPLQDVTVDTKSEDSKTSDLLPQKTQITFKEGAKGFIAMRNKNEKKGTIILSSSLILEGSFDATYTGFSLQCIECYQIKK